MNAASTADGSVDAVVVGGGFYGAALAVYLAKRGLGRIHLLEREGALLARASLHNQARVHTGYHYPRSFTTAYRSRINAPRFLHDWPQAIERRFTKLYAIARRQSHVTARQFERFCREIGAPLEQAPPALASLFDARRIEAVYLAEEYAFDAAVLAGMAARALQDAGVAVSLRSQARQLQADGDAGLRVIVSGEQGERSLRTRYLFNCTYSALNRLAGAPASAARLKHELTEMALVELPDPLRGLGVTVMDGPFFSLMPFPSRGLHTLSHVRYTPHLHWDDGDGSAPYERLQQYPRDSRYDRMQRDVIRYLPAMAGARHVDSLFEVKTVLVRNEGDDGRPILFEASRTLPGYYAILGGKIDNIYDVFERLDAEPLTTGHPHE